jgi:hypothetical protein
VENLILLFLMSYLLTRGTAKDGPAAGAALLQSALGYFVGIDAVMEKHGWSNVCNDTGPFLRPAFGPRLTMLSKMNFGGPKKRDSREPLLGLTQIGDESFCVCAELVDGFCGGNVEGSIIGIAPGEIGWLLGHDNSA